MMSEKVTFQELVDSIAGQTDNTKQFTHDFLKEFVSVINEGLDNDGTVNIAGFGKFKLRAMDEREGVNPQTREKIIIPAHNKVVFKPYKDLRELVNAPYEHLEPELLDENTDDHTSETEISSDTKPSPISEENTLGSAEKLEIDNEKAEQQEITEATAQESADDEAPFGFEEHESQDQSVLKTEKSQEGDAEHDIVEYSPHLRKDDKSQPASNMLLDLPMMQKSKIPEAENLKLSDPEHTTPTEADVSNVGSGEQEDSIVEDPFIPEQESDEEQLNDEHVGIPELSDPTVEPEETTGKRKEADALSLESSDRSNKKGSFRIVSAAVILLLIGIGIWYVFAPRNTVFDNVSGMITQIADRSWNQPVVHDQPDLPSQQKPERADHIDQNESNLKTRAADTEVTIPKGQTLWSLADQEYDDPYLWPWIYDRNKTSLGNPDRVPAGQSLRVPVPSGEQGMLGGEDSLGVALGYVETYRWYKANNYNKAKYYLYAAKRYRGNVFDHTDVNVDKADLAFANRVR